MDSRAFNDGLAGLRELRDEIRPLEKTLARLYAQRDKQITALGAYSKAKAERLAPAAGLAVKAIVALVPELAPGSPDDDVPVPRQPVQETTAAVRGDADSRAGALPPALDPLRVHPDTNAGAPTGETATTPPTAEPVAAHREEPISAPEADSRPAPGIPVPPHPTGLASATGTAFRELPSIPEGADGDRWFAVTPRLVSERPNYPQKITLAVFLDASTGVLAWRDHRYQLNLPTGSAAEILTAVYATVPDSVERIYITTGDPWHRDADRYPYLKDAVTAWLDAPLPEGWQVDTGSGKDTLAGHFVHERRPVGRWRRGPVRTEIRSVTEWFDPDGADPTVVRHAFNLTWEALKRHWSDVVLMGSPSQTGRDLWSRTIPTKQGARWTDGYPVMSDEIRQLLHATSGQGRTELITPPRVPEQLPQWTELDRTLAYGKHTWASGVGPPERVTARTFTSWTEKQQTNALFAPSHWHVRVTVPDNWNHIGLLPAAIEGEKAWTYPSEPGRTFTTWAGGAEINAALRNPLTPWRIEILDGLLWEAGTPLREWSEKLKEAWASLTATAQHAGTDELRLAYRLASRAVRSILLFGIGSFAQRPRITTGSVPAGQENRIPQGARVTGMEGNSIVWERTSMSRSPWAHPEWASGVWSAARAALLSTRAKTADGRPAHVGALHLPPGSIIAFRTDAIYTTTTPDWAYHGEPGEYRRKGHLPHPVAAPNTMEEFSSLQALARNRPATDAQQ
ncbi:Mucin-19 [Streptomyces sp. NPDC020965]|uniref:Mucin-19 n=1 Tax=Streptomyces sp. NPDC020965 TaxID=3365105 RepID=UPI0037BD38EE